MHISDFFINFASAIERLTNSIEANKQKDMATTNKAQRFINKHDNLVCVFADAITYSGWIDEVTIPKEFKDCKKEAKAKGIDVTDWCIEDKWAYIILNGGHINIIKKGKESKQHELTMKKIRKGWGKLMADYPYRYANIMTENDDLIDHDTLIQLALFGKLVYG